MNDPGLSVSVNLAEKMLGAVDMCTILKCALRETNGWIVKRMGDAKEGSP
jgi:hypothetical protein